MNTIVLSGLVKRRAELAGAKPIPFQLRSANHLGGHSAELTASALVA